MHRLTIQCVSLLKIIGPMCKSFNEKGFTRTSGVFFPLFRPPALLSLFFMQFVDILFYIIIVCDLVLVIFILQSVLSAFHILLTICFSRLISQPITHCALRLVFLNRVQWSSECRERAQGKKIANSTSNGQHQRDLIEWIGVIHLQVCIFGLLKNCNDLGVK